IRARRAPHRARSHASERGTAPRSRPPPTPRALGRAAGVPRDRSAADVRLSRGERVPEPRRARQRRRPRSRSRASDAAAATGARRAPATRAATRGARTTGARARAQEPLRLLCVHGIAGHPQGGPWEEDWRVSIRTGLAQAGSTVEPVVEFVYLDPIFDRYPVDFWDTLEALAKLAGSAVAAPFREARGVTDVVRLTAGMIVEWVANEDFRRETRDLLAQRMREVRRRTPCSATAWDRSSATTRSPIPERAASRATS